MLSIVCAVAKYTVRCPWHVLLDIQQEIIQSTHQHDTTNIVNSGRDGAKDSADAIWQQYSLYLYTVYFFIPSVNRALRLILSKLPGGTNIISVGS